MSKLNTLKTQNPDLDISLIDALGVIYKTKYVEMYLNIYKNKKSRDKVEEEDDDENISAFQMEMVDMGFDEKHITGLDKKLNHLQKHFISDFVGDLGYRDMRTFNKFIELNERGLVDNKDVTSYKTMDDVLSQISIAELKLIDKELEKLVLKLHEDDEWLIIKPLTYESSKKYGAGTRWCTAADQEDYQFYNYTQRGNLIYIINKKTGYKVAAFKNLDKDHPRELSFWNAEDSRVDSLELNLPNEIMDILITDLRNCQQSNHNLSPDEIKKINSDARGSKKENNTLHSLRDMIHEYGMSIAEPTAEPSIYTTATTNNTLNYEGPQQG
jgi:hypothetical protein